VSPEEEKIIQTSMAGSKLNAAIPGHENKALLSASAGGVFTVEGREPTAFFSFQELAFLTDSSVVFLPIK